MVGVIRRSCPTSGEYFWDYEKSADENVMPCETAINVAAAFLAERSERSVLTQKKMTKNVVYCKLRKIGLSIETLT
jgi:hypothetical protein